MRLLLRTRLHWLMRTAVQRSASSTSAGHTRLAEETSKSDSTPPSFAVPRPIASSCSPCPRLRLHALPATKRPAHPSHRQPRGRPAYMSPSSSPPWTHATTQSPLELVLRQRPLHTQHCNCFLLRSRSSSLHSRTLPVGPASYFRRPHYYAPFERYTAISISASPPSRNRRHLLGLTASLSLAAHHLWLYLLHVKLCCPSLQT